jgi:hypothetical protein
LDNLETAPATYKQYMLCEREMPTKKCPSDNFIDCVVAANILTQSNHASAGVKQGCGMEASGAAENRLIGPQNLRQRA